MSTRMTSKIAALAAAALTFPAVAAETVTQQVPPADACIKTVNAMGASMGHQADVGPHGNPVYRFVLRQNGFDYDVVCDAATGIVGDVTPRTTH